MVAAYPPPGKDGMFDLVKAVWRERTRIRYHARFWWKTPRLLDPTRIRWKIREAEVFPELRQRCRRLGIFEGKLDAFELRVGGDWDTHAFPFVYPFDEELKQTALRHRYGRAGSWDASEYLAVNGFGEEYVQSRDELFETLKREGFRLPRPGSPWIEPIVVHVNRHNQVLWTANGNHRLAMCLALGMSQIPVFVGLIHQAADDPFADFTPYAGNTTDVSSPASR